MYLAVVLLMGVLPIASVLAEIAFSHSETRLPIFIGKWFVFWAVGVRLLLAGLRQIVNPASPRRRSSASRTKPRS